jgi:hypothetical protein
VVLAWIQELGYNWQAVTARKHFFPPVAATVVKIPGLAKGIWKAEVWDTWGGTALSEKAITVGLDGNATVDVPSFTGDVALRLTKEPS